MNKIMPPLLKHSNGVDNFSPALHFLVTFELKDFGARPILLEKFSN